MSSSTWTPIEWTCVTALPSASESDRVSELSTWNEGERAQSYSRGNHRHLLQMPPEAITFCGFHILNQFVFFFQANGRKCSPNIKSGKESIGLNRMKNMSVLSDQLYFVFFGVSNAFAIAIVTSRRKKNNTSNTTSVKWPPWQLTEFIHQYDAYFIYPSSLVAQQKWLTTWSVCGVGADTDSDCKTLVRSVVDIDYGVIMAAFAGRLMKAGLQRRPRCVVITNYANGKMCSKKRLAMSQPKMCAWYAS